MKTKLMLLFTSILLVGCSLNSKTSTNSSSDSETKKLAAPVITLNNSTLTWDEVTNATSYRIYENGEIKYNQIVKTQYEINVTDPGTYVYAVVAFNKYNLYEESDKSNEVTYTYAKPVDLVAPVITIKDKVVSWNKVNTATTYNIYSNGEFLIEVSQTSYTLNFTEVGGYNIQVQAKRGDDVSPLSNMVVYKNTTGLIVNTNSSWNRTGLYDEWTRTGDFDTGVGEGFDMKAGASAFVYHSITNETKFMKVSIRVFHRDGETYPKFYVYIDGMIVREQEASEDWVTTESDNPTDFVYDLSNYVGQDVFIKFYEAAATHCCITSVALLEKTGAQLSENTSWSTKDEFFSDWYTSSVSSTINEGPDFAGSGVAKIIINVTSVKRYFSVEWRMFNGQDDNEAHITFSVNKNIVRAINGTEDYVVVKAEAGDPHFTYVYDLNDYVGEKVTLSLASINNVNHCVFLKASLTETAI